MKGFKRGAGGAGKKRCGAAAGAATNRLPPPPVPAHWGEARRRSLRLAAEPRLATRLALAAEEARAAGFVVPPAPGAAARGAVSSQEVWDRPPEGADPRVLDESRLLPAQLRRRLAQPLGLAEWRELAAKTGHWRTFSPHPGDPTADQLQRQAEWQAALLERRDAAGRREGEGDSGDGGAGMAGRAAFPAASVASAGAALSASAAVGASRAGSAASADPRDRRPLPPPQPDILASRAHLYRELLARKKSKLLRLDEPSETRTRRRRRRRGPRLRLTKADVRAAAAATFASAAGGEGGGEGSFEESAEGEIGAGGPVGARIPLFTQCSRLIAAVKLGDTKIAPFYPGIIQLLSALAELYADGGGENPQAALGTRRTLFLLQCCKTLRGEAALRRHIDHLVARILKNLDWTRLTSPQVLRCIENISALRFRLPPAGLASLNEMPYFWPTLTPPQVVGACNAVANLGIGRQPVLESLRLVLRARLPNAHQGRALRSMGSMAALTMLDYEGLDMFLRLATKHWSQFRKHTRALEVIELFLRLFAFDQVYEPLPAEVKGFLEFARTEESFRSRPSAAAQAERRALVAVIRRRLEPRQAAAARFGVVAGPFWLPVAWPDAAVALDVCSAKSFFAGGASGPEAGGSPNLTPAAKLRRLLLQGMGFETLVNFEAPALREPASEAAVKAAIREVSRTRRLNAWYRNWSLKLQKALRRALPAVAS